MTTLATLVDYVHFKLVNGRCTSSSVTDKNLAAVHGVRCSGHQPGKMIMTRQDRWEDMHEFRQLFSKLSIETSTSIMQEIASLA